MPIAELLQEWQEFEEFGAITDPGEFVWMVPAIRMVPAIVRASAERTDLYERRAIRWEHLDDEVSASSASKYVTGTRSWCLC